MIAEKLNDGWTFFCGAVNNWEYSNDGEGNYVNLPHDAMILEERSRDTANGSNTGYYPGNVYTYRKKLPVPAEWEEKEIFLEFDGVYRNARVFINDDFAVQRPYGYSQFSVRINDFLNYGEENEIRVVADTSMEKDSRWYSGGGIYRDVKLYVANRLHIGLYGVKITTPDVAEDYAQVMVDVAVENADGSRKTATLAIELMDAAGNTVAAETVPFTAYGNETVHLRRRLGIKKPHLWNCDTPYLYRCCVSVKQGEELLDRAVSGFGIRKLQLDAEHGLRINGRVTNLRGACIHHDHGIIGAISLSKAEERKVRQLKEAGFNCIRSAHNPAGPALLDACDKYGILVMEEAFDMWTNTKCDNDYANDFPEWWEADIESMVRKDFNHPSVILYSVGNEIDEAGTKRGAYWNRRLADKIRNMDDTRYITNGINGMIIIMDQMEAIVPEIMRKLEEKDADDAGQNENSGSDDLNNLISIAGGETGDMLFANPLIGERTEQIYGAMDIAGMNYMAIRYEIDHKTYPNRVMLGTETFPEDIARLWSLVMRNNHVIGDMTWTGYDYLGEAGCGIFRYDGTPNFGAKWPARAAYIGDINLIGSRRPISYYREIVFGFRKEPYIAVERLEHYGEKATKTPWMMFDDIASWTWQGFEGRSAIVHVFSASEEVELVLNGRSLGRKKAGEEEKFIAGFELDYEPGTLLAIGYTAGKEDGRMELVTASEELSLEVEADRTKLRADGADLAFLTIRLKDKNGILNPHMKKKIAVSVEGAGVLQGFGSADPESEGNYFDTECETFEGEVMAVVRSIKEPGEIVVRVASGGMEERSIWISSIAVEERGK